MGMITRENPLDSVLCIGLAVLYLLTVIAVVLCLMGVDNRKVVTGGFILAYVLAVVLAYT